LLGSYVSVVVSWSTGIGPTEYQW